MRPTLFIIACCYSMSLFAQSSGLKTFSLQATLPLEDRQWVYLSYIKDESLQLIIDSAQIQHQQVIFSGKLVPALPQRAS